MKFIGLNPPNQKKNDIYSVHWSMNILVEYNLSLRGCKENRRHLPTKIWQNLKNKETTNLYKENPKANSTIENLNEYSNND